MWHPKVTGGFTMWLQPQEAGEGGEPDPRDLRALDLLSEPSEELKFPEPGGRKLYPHPRNPAARLGYSLFSCVFSVFSST